MLRVFIEPNNLFDKEVRYTWDLFACNKQLNYEFVDSVAQSDLSIGGAADFSIQVSTAFYEKLKAGKYHHSFHFNEHCWIELDDKKADLLSTAFYMINCIQEINHPVKDRFGRFPFSESYQKKFKCPQQNLVQHYFDRLSEQFDILKFTSAKKSRTKIFLTHDIDIVHGSLIQDGFDTLKKGRFGKLMKVTYLNLLQGPQWINMSAMADVEKANKFTSTFFWLVRKGRVNELLSNADYNINDTKIKNEIAYLKKNGFGIGLHKSADSSGFEEERIELGETHISNRYHYLKFNPTDDFKKLEMAGYKLDSSLGFAETHGFRNSYGLPFRPFDLSERRTMSFVECPLHVMDTTFFNYKKVNSDMAYSEITDFITANQNQCVITVLFHNNFISDYKYMDYKELFLRLLKFFNASNFECITESEIIQTYLNGN